MLTMTPELRLKDAERKALLLVMWKCLCLWLAHLCRTRSTQMMLAPRMQAVERLISRDRRRRQGWGHSPTPETVLITHPRVSFSSMPMASAVVTEERRGPVGAAQGGCEGNDVRGPTTRPGCSQRSITAILRRQPLQCLQQVEEMPRMRVMRLPAMLHRQAGRVQRLEDSKQAALLRL